MGEDEEGWMGMGRARCVAGGGMGHKALRRRSTLHLRRCGSDRSSEGAVVGAGAAAVQGRDAGGEGLRHKLRADEVHVRVEAARRHNELLT